MFGFNLLMKIKLLIFSLLLSTNLFASITIVSDLDDTIKITEGSGDPSDILGDEVYAGMPAFLKLARDYSTSLYIVSASPSILRKKIESTLKKKLISYKGLILRTNLFESKFDYKVRKIKEIMDKTSDDFILIGDDLGQDPEVFVELGRLFPHRVIGSYIHVVENRVFDSSLSSYWTSFDLILKEFQEYRMKAESVEVLARILMAEKNLELIFPKKADCPTSDRVWEWQLRTIFMLEAQKLIERFNRFCQVRQSDKNLH